MYEVFCAQLVAYCIMDTFQQNILQKYENLDVFNFDFYAISTTQKRYYDCVYQASFKIKPRDIC